MHFQSSLALLSALALTQASSIPYPSSLSARDTTLCGQYDGTDSGNGYTIQNNAWGKDTGSGYTCTYFESTTSSGVKWRSQWQWSGGPNLVKSYPYSGRNVQKGLLLSDIKDMPSYFDWSYDNEDIVADVAYDLFSAADPNHPTSSGDYEVMVWLGQYGGIQPISDNGPSTIATPNINGVNWNLYYGHNGDMQVYSFVAQNAPLRQFSGDVKLFWNYLTDNQGFPATEQYLLTFQAGTEPVSGDSTFRVNEWNGFVNTF